MRYFDDGIFYLIGFDLIKTKQETFDNKLKKISAFSSFTSNFKTSV